MCDYSLEGYQSRPAAVGENMTLKRFGSGSMGFTSGPTQIEHPSTKKPTTVDCADCVPVGSHLRIEGIDEALQQTLGVGASEEVVMTRIAGGLHKDAVLFKNGREISLQSLNPGLKATMFVPLPDLGLDTLDKVQDELAGEGGSSIVTRELVAGDD